ncbi:MarR family winged helix-turn-helix transcriptional regulator [Leucobacter sp. OH1287]|uniref:MarR family winged helix-turn-helix transcriptional regulator n=1 Tax=Leucobacter sp. OH1287 TaxID=2491049 RepID=UPI000F5EEA9A|nr:MarR family transcriptional regulator [Leucobacter sp. OH1287]RRD61587.1 MarR family transcriptional regulator [Leucobacter sp. OH1287]
MSINKPAILAWESMVRAENTLKYHFQQSAIWNACGNREYDVLYNLKLAPDGKAKQADLVPRLVISQPSLSRIIDKLVRKGYVARTPDPNDGRGAILTLTSEGKRMQRRIGRAYATEVSDIIANALSDEEIEQLDIISKKLLEQLHRHLED